jgi:putative ABC transport system permease protein
MIDPKKLEKNVALRLLRSFCPPHLLEEIEGDLCQRFERDARAFGENRARRKLLWNVLRFFRSGILLRNRPSFNRDKLLLLSNYFKTSFRHAAKNKLNFAFKVSGLALAFYSFMVIATYIFFQFSFDKFHAHYDNIYRVNSLRKENGKDKRWATVPSALGPAMKASLPDVKEYCVLSEWGTSVCRVDDQLHRVSFLEADSSVFNVFTFEFIKGDESVLNRPGGLVVTESLAKQLFADKEPINQLISFPDRNNKILEVRGVIKDLPANSSIDAKAIMLRGALADDEERNSFSNWSFRYGGNLFVLLEKQTDLSGLEKRAK